MSDGDEEEWIDCDEDLPEENESLEWSPSPPHGLLNEFHQQMWLSVDDYFKQNDVISGNDKYANEFSLAEICLKCIANNIRSVAIAHFSSEDPVLRRNLTFLQRVYTPELIASLIKKGTYKDEYIDLVLNDYLRELNIGNLIVSTNSLKFITEKLEKVGHNLTKASFTKICFPGNDMYLTIPDFLCTIIPYLPNVESLCINHYCNDTILEKISFYCSKLTELDINHSSDVTKKGLEMLCKNPEGQPKECLLKKLSMRGIGLTDSIITFFLKYMPNIEALEYPPLPNILYSMHKNDFKNNKLENVKTYKLTELNLKEPATKDNVPDILQVYAKICPNIKNLFVGLSTKNDLLPISDFKNLEKLSILNTNYRFELINLDNFLKSCCGNLHDLSIDRFALSSSDLLENCTKLERLHLSDVSFQYQVGNATNKKTVNNSLKNLTEFILNGFEFVEKRTVESVTNILLNSPNLEILFFHTCKFEFENYSDLNTKLAKYFENCKLEKLRFTDCNIELAFLESVILTCPSLVSLAIDSCENISYSDATHLQTLTNPNNNYVDIVYTNENEEDDEYDISDGDFGFSNTSGSDYEDYDYDVGDDGYGYNDYDNPLDL